MAKQAMTAEAIQELVEAIRTNPELMRGIAAAVASDGAFNAALAAKIKANARKAFEVEPLGELHKHKIVVQEWNKDARKFTPVEKEIVGGYMVYFPQGHSMFIESEEQLQRLGLNSVSGLVDMDTGMNVDDINPESIRERIESRARGSISRFNDDPAMRAVQSSLAKVE
jgi:hypothetical protein